MKKYLLTIIGILISSLSVAQITTPAGENFDGAVFPPANWAIFDNGINGSGDVNWDLNENFFNSTPNSAFMDRNNLDASPGNTKIAQDFLATPAVTLPLNAQIKFQTTNSSSLPFAGMRYQVRIKLASAGPQNNPSGYVTIREWNDTNDALVAQNGTFEEKVITNIAAQYIGVPVYIAFCVQNTQADIFFATQRWFVDDVKIEQQCFSPALTSLTATPLFNQSTFTWAAVPGAIGYEVENVFGSSPFLGVPSNLNPIIGTTYTQTGLTATTNYKYQVRSVCAPGNFGPWVGPFDYATTVTPPVCGGVFTDHAGPNANYGANRNDTVIINPTVSTDQVTVTFTSFNLEQGSDFLSVYDGQVATPAALIGTFSGTSISPLSFTGSTANGSLTFVFTSDGTQQRAGWIANVTCAPPPPCAKPTLLLANAITPTTATIDWTQIANPNGTTATNFEYLILPAASPEPVLTVVGTTTTKPLSLTNLAQGTCFDVYVRAVCFATEKSKWSKKVNFCTLIAPPVCGGIFVDNGGLLANYLNNSNNTLNPTVICPTVPTDKVTVNFTAFNTEATFDGLYVYNGSTVTPANLINSGNLPANVPGGLAGAYWGTTIPGPFDSTTADGCLTFVFISEGFGNREGWRADVTCAPVPTCIKPKNLVTSAITANSIRVAWTNVTTGTNEVLVLPCGSPTPNLSSSGFVVATSNPFIIPNLSSGTCYDIYVRTKCSETDTSVWSIKTSAYTAVLPEICNGNFVDQGGLGFGDTFNYPESSNKITIICPTVGTNQRVTVTFTEFDTEANWDGLYVYDGNAVNPLNLLPSQNPPGTVPGGLAGSYWGTTIPGPFTSESADGCLTFVFRSDPSVQRKGWLSNITCTPIPFCKKPRNLVATPTNLATQMTLSWTQLANLDGSFATAWRVIALPCGSPKPTDASPWINTTVRPYKFNNLAINTCYDFYVQAVCSGTESSDLSTPVKANTPLSCGQNFLDNGGLVDNYNNNSNDTTVICPTLPGTIIRVNFSAFDVDATNDGLYVFDGNSETAPQILSGNGAGNVPGNTAGAFWGTNIPGPFESSSPTGCLTFKFRSNGFTDAQGWAAAVTCITAPTCARPFEISAIPTSITAIISWTQPTNFGTTSVADNWEIIVQLATATPPTAASPGIETNNPYLATNLNPDSAYSVYIRAVCSNSDKSDWSTVYNFNTYPINDECTGAISVIVNEDLNYNPLTSAVVKVQGSSISSQPNTCLTTLNGDVWFKFVANSDVQVLSIANESLNPNVTLNQNDVEKLNFAVYSGTCTALTQIYCGDTQATVNNAGVIKNLTVGQTYYIRAFGTNTTDQSLIYRMTLGKIPVADSILFCGQYSYANATGGKRRDLDDLGCLFSTPNPRFFKLVVQTTGTLNYLITQGSQPGGAEEAGFDVDYVSWGPFASEQAATLAVSSLATTIPQGTCPALHGCSYSAAPTENFCIPNAIACQIYIVMVNNFSDRQGYINFTQQNLGTGGQTICADPVQCSYSKKEFCKDELVNPIIILDSGPPPSVAGLFSIVPPTASFDPLTGEIDLATIEPGTYIVTNTLAVIIPDGICALPFATKYSVTVVITAPANASISYATTTFCNNQETQICPSFTGTLGGRYKSATAGLAIDAISGCITPQTSLPGTYDVTYKVDATGGCPAFETAPIQITILALPVIVAPNDVIGCGNSYTLPALVGNNMYYTLPNGQGTNLPAGTVITVSPTKIYVYENNGTCYNEKDFTITLRSILVPSINFSYTSANSTTAFCQSERPNPFPFRSGTFTNGGIFSATPNVLGIDPVTGTIDMGSPAGSYTITYTLLADPTRCILSTITRFVPFTIIKDINAVTEFNYPNATYCKNETNPTPTIVADFNTTGVYSAPSGLTINPNTGLITLATSTPGLYKVKYKVLDDTTICLKGSESTFDVRIKPVITVTNTLSYGAAGASSLEVCKNETNLLPFRTSTTFTDDSVTGVVETNSISGIYSATPPGLEFVSATTGLIDMLNSLPGTYQVIFTSNTSITNCRAAFVSLPFTLKITANAQAVADFNYAKNVYCKNELNPSPEALSTRTLGGSYTSTSGIVLNGATGEIDLDASTPGTYKIIYEVSPTNVPSCIIGDFKEFDVTINANIQAVTGFEYNKNEYFKTEANPVLNVLNPALFTTGGTYSSIPATGINLNSTTGAITLEGSTPGIYVITYSVTQNFTPCLLAGSTQFTVEIKDSYDAVTTLAYSNTIYCANQGIQNPLISSPARTAGGVYSATPTGLIIDPATGAINLVQSTAGTYNIVYTVQTDNSIGLIGGVTTPPFVVKINPVIVPTFSEIVVCQGGTVNFPTQSNNVGNTIQGTFVNNSVSTNTPGTYTSIFSPANGECASTVATVTVKVIATPVFTVTGNCEGANYTLKVVPAVTGATYEWSNGSGIIPGASSQLVITDNGSYSCKVTVNGCSDTISLPVDDSSCVIQKGISPNGDNSNEFFDLTALDVKNLEIFNRYGRLVYSKSNYKKEWFGQTDAGETLPDGTYFYVINQKNGESKTGWVYINK